VRADMVGRSAGMLTAAGGEAIRTLLTLQKDSTPSVRLGAARTILEMGLKIRQMVDLEQRMAELEELVAAQDANRSGGWQP
jgi:hypothetical protein